MWRGIIVLSLLVCFSPLVFAEADIPVEIKADQLKSIEGSNLVEAHGSVEVKLKEVTIYCDSLRMDQATNIATAEGNVSLFTHEYRAQATRLVYDADQAISTFSGFSARLSPRNARGDLYVAADKFKDLKDKMEGGPGSVTTCDRADPHFILKANKVSYFPEDKIVGWNVTMYTGELPVLWLPYVFYDLKGKRKKSWDLGHNEVEGDFVKTAWLYPAGLLLVDYMQKKGLGYGTESEYGLGRLGLGKLYLYHLDEKDTGTSSWVEKVQHKTPLNADTTLNLNQSYISIYRVPSGRIDQTAFGIGLDSAKWSLKSGILDDRAAARENFNLQYDLSAEKSRAHYALNYEFSKNDPKWLRNSQSFDYAQPLWSDKINFSTSARYYRSTDGTGSFGEEKIEPQVEIRGSEPAYSWRYTENWFIDMKNPATPEYEFLEKQPEIEIYPQQMDLRLFTLQPTIGYGYFREVRHVAALGRKRDFGAQRYRATLNGSRSIPLALGSTLVLGAGVDQFAYSPGDQLYALRENADLQSTNNKFFRNSINFRQGYTDGNTPFLFDQLGARYHDIRERMNFYYLDKFDWTLEGGHNWQTSKWFDVLTGLSLMPDPRVRFRLNTGWDIENRVYKDLVSSLRLTPYSFFAVDLSANKDMNTGDLKTASALYAIYFMEKQPNQMYLRFSQVYDPPSKEFKVRDIMIVKDLHCWEMKYTYSDYRKEFSIVFSLKALPEEPAGFSSGRGFYFEGFEKAEREITGLKQEGEIRRF